MSVFIGDKTKRVELAERKDATNPNLLLNSRDFSSNWFIRNATVTSDSYNGGKIVSLHTGGDGMTNDVRQATQTPTAQTVTWSVYAKADNAGDKLHTELFGGGGQTDQVLTTDWCRYTFHGISDPTNCTLYFWGVSGNKGDIYIALPKLEIGNTATPWCPAYDDYAWTGDITNLQNTVNSINGTWNRYTHNNGFDLLTLWGQYGIHYCLNSNMTNVPDWFTDKRGTAFVFSFDNNSQTIIYASCIGDGFAYYNKLDKKWHKVASDTDITNLQNTIQANKTDVTNLQSMITGLQSQIQAQQADVSNIQTGYMKKPTVISQADYDKLATKDPNTLYEITE